MPSPEVRSRSRRVSVGDYWSIGLAFLGGYVTFEAASIQPAAAPFSGANFAISMASGAIPVPSVTLEVRP